MKNQKSVDLQQLRFSFQFPAGCSIGKQLLKGQPPILTLNNFLMSSDIGVILITRTTAQHHHAVADAIHDLLQP